MQAERAAGPLAGRPGHRPDAGARSWSRCTAARSRRHSDGLGRGSEFVVRLPALPAPSRRSGDGRAGRGRRRREPPRRRVLVVDDNHDAADSLAMLLRLSGQDVRVAHDGPSALDAAEDFRPELVLLDIGLPAWTGTKWPGGCGSEPGSGATSWWP